VALAAPTGLGCPSPEAAGELGVRGALARQDRIRVQGAAGRPRLDIDLHPVAFREVSATFEGGRATVVALVEAEGRVAWGQGGADLSYIGREAFRMRPCPQGLCPEPDQVARLAGVLAALLGRQEALAATSPGRRVLAWQIRVERDTAEVGEDLEVPGESGAPVRERARLSLRLAGGRWTIAP